MVERVCMKDFISATSFDDEAVINWSIGNYPGMHWLCFSLALCDWLCRILCHSLN